MPTARRPKYEFDDFLAPVAPGFCRCTCGQRLTGRQRSWASKACLEAAYERRQIGRGDTKAIRAAVHRRDKSVCAICGLHCDLARDRARPGHYEEATEAERAVTRFRMHEGFPSPVGSRPWWQADHRTPLAEGGANTIENFRTLCVPCHKAETARLAGRLARAKKEARQQSKRQCGQICPH